ncbi:MAG: YbaB/EbfC family nucleoid-associated protein [Alphaproteobacteria bacterium]|nr:YbaB/EbfC family nucleoid-associated protein [Alphaproteobacteria bacterium]
MKNLNQMLKQAQELQAKMADMQNKLSEAEMIGLSGGGMVKITVNGKGEMKHVKIDPALMDSKDNEILEDLIIAAFNDAKAKVDSHMSEEMGKVTGGLALPKGFELPF